MNSIPEKQEVGESRPGHLGDSGKNEYEKGVRPLLASVICPDSFRGFRNWRDANLAPPERRCNNSLILLLHNDLDAPVFLAALAGRIAGDGPAIRMA